jgi:hypothetical protein
MGGKMQNVKLMYIEYTVFLMIDLKENNFFPTRKTVHRELDKRED